MTPLKPDIFCRSLFHWLQFSGVFCLVRLLCTDKAMLLVFMPNVTSSSIWPSSTSGPCWWPRAQVHPWWNWVLFVFFYSGLHQNHLVPVSSLLHLTSLHLFLLSLIQLSHYHDIYCWAQISTSNFLKLLRITFIKMFSSPRLYMSSSKAKRTSCGPVLHLSTHLRVWIPHLVSTSRNANLYISYWIPMSTHTVATDICENLLNCGRLAITLEWCHCMSALAFSSSTPLWWDPLCSL